MSRELNIVLFRRGRSVDGTDGYWRTGHEYSLSDFGGVLPDVGDVVVPYLKDIRDATEYKVYTVESRFFRPDETQKHFINVALVVTERDGKKEEQHLIVGGG
jgi:hypothetical protein